MKMLMYCFQFNETKCPLKLSLFKTGNNVNSYPATLTFFNYEITRRAFPGIRCAKVLLHVRLLPVNAPISGLR